MQSDPDRVPLYVRVPRDQAAALDRLVDTTGRRKQELVSDLLADNLQLGRIEIGQSQDRAAAEVLTLEEAAELLRLSSESVKELAQAGELPGRRVGEEWRFARAAILRWLSGETAEPPHDPPHTGGDA